MLEYTKALLQKVSFDKMLFVKELSKALSWVSKEERQALMDWTMAQFSSRYRNEISDAFKTIA